MNTLDEKDCWKSRQGFGEYPPMILLCSVYKITILLEYYWLRKNKLC